MGSESRATADPDGPFEDAVRADLNVVSEFDSGIDDGGGVDPRHDGLAVSGNRPCGPREANTVHGCERHCTHPNSDSGDSPPGWLEVRRLGRIGYREGLDSQRELHAEVLGARETATPRGFLLLLEHDPPVVTVSRRPGAAENLIATDAAFAERGIRIEETDRGGDVTYHGPGQLVAYPIVDLNLVRVRIHGWIRLLEQVVIDALASFECPADRDPGATGVWVGPHRRRCGWIGRSEDRGDRRPGVAVDHHARARGQRRSRPRALRHDRPLWPGGRPVTSIARELGPSQAAIPDMAQVTAAVGGWIRPAPVAPRAVPGPAVVGCLIEVASVRVRVPRRPPR